MSIQSDFPGYATLFFVPIASTVRVQAPRSLSLALLEILGRRNQGLLHQRLARLQSKFA